MCVCCCIKDKCIVEITSTELHCKKRKYNKKFHINYDSVYVCYDPSSFQGPIVLECMSPYGLLILFEVIAVSTLDNTHEN